MSKILYRVTDEVSKTATLLWARSQAQAIRHVTKGVFTAAPATVQQVERYMIDTKGAPIEDATKE